MEQDKDFNELKKSLKEKKDKLYKLEKTLRLLKYEIKKIPKIYKKSVNMNMLENVLQPDVMLNITIFVKNAIYGVKVNLI